MHTVQTQKNMWAEMQLESPLGDSICIAIRVFLRDPRRIEKGKTRENVDTK